MNMSISNNNFLISQISPINWTLILCLTITSLSLLNQTSQLTNTSNLINNNNKTLNINW